MSLLLVDLDNTLVDRSAAFAAFAREYVASRSRGPEDAAWLVETDGDGFTPRDAVAGAVRERFGLDDVGTTELIAVLRAGFVEWLVPDPDVAAALERARAVGWTVVVVTNGPERQQQRKIDHVGLRSLVSGVVVSEAVGIRKPDPRIFRLAARSVGGGLTGAWMIGDSAEGDVGGAHAVGINSVWLRRGRTWPADLTPPTAIADSFGEAVHLVLDGAL